MPVKERIESKKPIFESKNTKAFFECALFFLLGFIMSIGSVAKSLHPFGISIICVSKGKNILFSFLGAFLGFAVGGINTSFARYFAGAVFALIGAIAASIFELNERPAFPITIAFLADFVSGFVMHFRMQSVYTQYLILIGEAILCCGGAYFFYKSVNSSLKQIRFKALPFNEICCIMISASILLMNLSFINIRGFAPARAIAVAVSLALIKMGNHKWGMIFSLAFGFAFSVIDADSLFIVGAFAFSYLTASLFSESSSLAAGISYLCSFSFFCIISESIIAFPLFLEGALGVLIFLLLPSKLCAKIESIGMDEINSDSALRQSLVLKLRFASSAMSAISESVEQVREKINEITRKENEINKLNISEEEYIRREIILEKTNQIRMVASDQFFSISGMLEDLAFEFDESETFDKNACDKIRRLLAGYDIYPKNISAIEDKFSRMRVEILASSDCKNLNNPVFQNEIGRICSRYFTSGIITNFKDETMLSFFERPNYRLNIGFAQHCAEGNLCGDTVKIINDYKGHCILIISDGMGKGSRAALDGAMGAGLISKLINAGFGFDSALKIVNCALLVKSNDESLATLDIASIDMFTGKCELFKAGAPASFFIKNKEVIKCELSSMPAGILRGVEFAKRGGVLKLGDSLALMSDGIYDLGDKWLSELLASNSELSPQQKAQYILEQAVKKDDGRNTDDMSIIFATLERN